MSKEILSMNLGIEENPADSAEASANADIDALPSMPVFEHGSVGVDDTEGLPDDLLSSKEKRAREIHHIREALEKASSHEPIDEEKKAAIKANVNMIMPKLGLPPMKTLKVPDEQFGETEPLRMNGPVNILMVDNEPLTIIDLITPLSVVSEGHLDVFIQTRESAREVAEKIAGMDPQPDIIVMDYDLAGIMGDEVIAELKGLGVKSHIVGRSGNEAAILDFLKYNVPIAFYKPRDCDIDEEMAFLAELYDDRNAKFLDPKIAEGLVYDEPIEGRPKEGDEEKVGE